MLPSRTDKKSVLICFLLCSLWVLPCCAIISPARTDNDFKVVRARSGDSLSSLAARYLHDPSKGWIISEFNNIKTLTPGREIIIPLKAFRPGGLNPDGYQTVPILAYQRFSEGPADKTIVSRQAFENQMKFLKENSYRTITLGQLKDFFDFRGQIPEKAVVITFDEGWRSVYDIAFPIVKKYDFSAVLFVSTDFIGQQKALSWQQVKQLSKNGFDVQSLTKSHRNLVKMNQQESFKAYFNNLKKEITLSEELIRQQLNKKCTYLAYPYGKTSNLVIALLKKHGYQGAFTLKRGSNPCFTDKYRINRSAVLGNYDMERFKKSLLVFNKTKLK